MEIFHTDECLNDECSYMKCLHGGRCQKSFGGYFCQCSLGWSGKFCEEKMILQVRKTTSYCSRENHKKSNIINFSGSTFQWVIILEILGFRGIGDNMARN